MMTNETNSLLKHHHFNECETCAYHEAGHILFAYLCGYNCRQVELVNEANEEGYSSITIIDYGKDSEIADQFMGIDAHVDYFNCLSLGEKLESIEVGRRLARIFLGSSITVAVHNNNGNVHIPLPLQIDYTDLKRVEFIQKVIGVISQNKEEDFIENGLQEALYTLSNINLWNTVSDLAERLLASKQMSKGDIEECLEEHGIMYG